MDANLRLLELNALGWAVVLTASFGPGLQQRVPLTLQARGRGSGILIGPRGLADADLFCIRIEPELNPPAGRAVVVANGRAAAVQLAIAEPRSSGDSGGAGGLQRPA
jgi:S-DNA-T family DNA segregation ATPase FtsK/SpoIIIE